MKKRILSLTLALILIVAMFALTGCGIKESETSESSNTEETVDSSTKEEENTTAYEISLVEQSFSEDEDEAVVKLKDDDDNYYVIDADGKIIYTFTDEIDVSEGDKYINGYILINTDDDIYVKDLNTGKIIEQEDDSIEILDVTKDGYVLEIITVDELSGCTYYSTIIDKDGNKVWNSKISESEAYIFEILTDNYIAFKDTYTNGELLIIDATDGSEYDTGIGSGYYSYEILEDKIYIEAGAVGLRYGTMYFDKNTKQFTQLDSKMEGGNILNEKYYVKQGSDAGIYLIGEELTLVKDLTEGGVKHIYYKNNTYYIISDTGYYYTLNDSFEYVVEPTKINTDIYDLDYIYPTEYGILAWIEINSATYEKYLIPESDFRVDEDVTSKGNKFSDESNNSAYSDSICRYIFESELDNEEEKNDFLFLPEYIYNLLDIKTWEKITVHD